jgi:hypothetical protein
MKSRKLSEDELDAFQNKVFGSPFYGIFVIIGLIASLYCGVVLWNL